MKYWQVDALGNKAQACACGEFGPSPHAAARQKTSSLSPVMMYTGAVELGASFKPPAIERSSPRPTSSSLLKSVSKTDSLNEPGLPQR